jgi:ubiquinone/menaquinone biosynthesis C-methylase UbiE
MSKGSASIAMSYFLASPLRRLFHNPRKILAPHVRNGMKVLDIGCGMGFFTLPLAKMVGPEGRIICVDMDVKVFGPLLLRTMKAKLFDRIETRICDEKSLGLDGLSKKIDFIFAFAVAHEVPDVSSFFSELCRAGKLDSRFLVVEPKGHVSEGFFNRIVTIAEHNGLEVMNRPEIPYCHAVLMNHKRV